MKKILGFVKNNLIILITAAINLIIGVILFLLWKTKYENNGYGDLLVNLCSSFFVAFITLITVEIVNKKYQNRARIPYLMMRYREIQIFVSVFIGLWSCIYSSIAYEKERKEISYDELFSKKTFKIINKKFDISAKCKIDKSYTWQYYINYWNNKIRKQIENIIYKYGHDMDSKLYFSILYLLKEGTLLSIKNKKILIKNKPYSIKYDINVSNEECEQIKNIINWCNEEYENLKNNKEYKIYNIGTSTEIREVKEWNIILEGEYL